MVNLKRVWLCAWLNFRKWPVTPHLYTIAMIMIAFSLWMFSWIADYAAAVDHNVAPWVFPFLMNMPIMFPIFGCLTTLLFSNAPFVDQHTPFLLVRINRRNWLLGQLLYIVLASFVYILVFVMLSMISLLPHLTFTTDWGTILRTLAFRPDSSLQYGITPYLSISDPVFSHFSPITAMFISFGMCWLVSCFIGVLIFSLSLLFNRAIGLIAAGACTFMGYFSIYVGKIIFGPGIFYLSPLNWSSMFYLDWAGTGGLPSPFYAVCILLLVTILLSIGVVSLYKDSRDFQM